MNAADRTERVPASHLVVGDVIVPPHSARWRVVAVERDGDRVWLQSAGLYDAAGSRRFYVLHDTMFVRVRVDRTIRMGRKADRP